MNTWKVQGTTVYELNADYVNKWSALVQSPTASREELEEIAQLIQQTPDLKNRVSQLTAARIAYANEFPLNEDGETDVGNIHRNIREMKDTLQKAKEGLETLKEETDKVIAGKQSAYILVAAINEALRQKGY